MPHLFKILSDIQLNQKTKEKSLVVFDLDSTLFDVSPRIRKILHDFAHSPENQRRFPESTEILKSVDTQRTDWGIKNALMRAGLHLHSTEFHIAVRDFWMKCFFSNEYLEYDLPYEGAADYVNRIYDLGADIVYLTGRDISGMGAGTEKVLKKWNFPVSTDRVELALKPLKGADDAQFKKEWFLKIPPEKYKNIWFFENEPLNVNEIRQHFDHIEIIFFESTHSGKATPPTDLPRIFHYLMDEEK